MKTLYIITEALYHTSYLVGKTLHISKYDKVVHVIRNKNKLRKKNLDILHQKYAGQKQLTQQALNEFEHAYGELSLAEIKLMQHFGIPRHHCFSAENTIIIYDLNDVSLRINITRRHEIREAIIFLDSILKPWWISLFEGRIVNGHSAILPNARGMFAIEQFILQATVEEIESTAGATIHYVNEGIDTGAIIKKALLENIWSLDSIWDVKAFSYMMAFDLLNSIWPESLKVNKNRCL